MVASRNFNAKPQNRKGAKPFFPLCAFASLRLCVEFCFGMFVAALSADASDGVALLPAKVSLSGPTAMQQILVEKTDGTHFVGQVTNDVSLSSSDAKVVKVEGG